MLQTKPLASQITPIVQRQVNLEDEEDEELLQTKPLANQITRLVHRQMDSEDQSPVDTNSVESVLRSPGRPLDNDTRTFMESRFGYDLGSVRVHSGAKAAESARVVNAMAYTVGPNVVFDQDNYQPRTIQGRQLLAHELVHVAQQCRLLRQTQHAKSKGGLSFSGIHLARATSNYCTLAETAHTIDERVLNGLICIHRSDAKGATQTENLERLFKAVPDTKTQHVYELLTVKNSVMIAYFRKFDEPTRQAMLKILQRKLSGDELSKGEKEETGSLYPAAPPVRFPTRTGYIEETKDRRIWVSENRRVYYPDIDPKTSEVSRTLFMHPPSKLCYSTVLKKYIHHNTEFASEDEALKVLGSLGEWDMPKDPIEFWSEQDKLIRAFELARDQLPARIGDRIGELLTLKTLAMIGIALATAILCEFLTAGWCTLLIGAVLLYFSPEIIDHISEIKNHFASGVRIAKNATTEKELKVAGDHLANGVTKLGVDIVLIFLLHKTHKGGGAIGKYTKTAIENARVKYAITPEGKAIPVGPGEVPDANVYSKGKPRAQQRTRIMSVSARLLGEMKKDMLNKGSQTVKELGKLWFFAKQRVFGSMAFLDNTGKTIWRQVEVSIPKGEHAEQILVRLLEEFLRKVPTERITGGKLVLIVTKLPCEEICKPRLKALLGEHNITIELYQTKVGSRTGTEAFLENLTTPDRITLNRASLD